MRHLSLLVVCLTCLAVGQGIRATPAAAFNPLNAVCDVASLTSGVAGKACKLVSGAGRVLSAGKDLLTGHVGSALKDLLSQGSGAVTSGARAALSLAAIGAWVLGGARFILHETAHVLSEKTTPQLGTSWFSATYWRVAGIAALLTLPFLFAASIQALVRSDLPLLLRAALGYLPLAMLVVGVAAPVTMLLLSSSDELSGLVASATGHPGARALTLEGVLAGGLAGLTGSTFLIVFFGILTVAGAAALWMELLMREAAVYVVVLMLPLAFAAMVWPARRMWAIRAVELLVALILSKFAIVAVLALGGAAMDQVGHSFTAAMVGLVLVMMGAFAPWALLRLVPLSELGANALDSLRGHGRMAAGRADMPFEFALAGDEWASVTTRELRRSAEHPAPDGPATPPRMGDDPDAGQEPPEDRGERGGAGAEPHTGTGPTPAQDLDAYATGLPGDGMTASAGADHAGNTDRSGADSRLPGLADMWQADDLSWRPLNLGTDEGWPPQVWPPPGSPDGPTSEAVDAPVGDGREGLPDGELPAPEASAAPDDPLSSPD